MLIFFLNIWIYTINTHISTTNNNNTLFLFKFDLINPLEQIKKKLQIKLKSFYTPLASYCDLYIAHYVFLDLFCMYTYVSYICCCSVTKLCPTHWDPMDCSTSGVCANSCPWGFPSKNSGVGCHFLLQGNLSTQG